MNPLKEQLESQLAETKPMLFGVIIIIFFYNRSLQKG
jgi:hypothetical protein